MESIQSIDSKLENREVPLIKLENEVVNFLSKINDENFLIHHPVLSSYSLMWTEKKKFWPIN